MTHRNQRIIHYAALDAIAEARGRRLANQAGERTATRVEPQGSPPEGDRPSPALRHPRTRRGSARPS